MMIDLLQLGISQLKVLKKFPVVAVVESDYSVSSLSEIERKRGGELEKNAVNKFLTTWWPKIDHCNYLPKHFNSCFRD